MVHTKAITKNNITASEQVHNLVAGAPLPPQKREVALLVHPMLWVSLFYKLSGTNWSIKHWYLANKLPTQVSLLKNSETPFIRVEYLEQDIGYRGKIEAVYKPPLCLATRAHIRRTYLVDYSAGDYDL